MKVKRILVSQPVPQTDKNPYQELCDKHGVKIDFRQFIEVAEVSAKEFRKDKVNILEHTAVILTSKTAIDHFFRICEELRIVIPDTMKYFCITESIAFYLQKYITYRKRKIFVGVKTFENLMELIVKHKQENYLVPLSDIHQDDIPTLLEKNKIKYSKAILYKTVSANLSDITDFTYDILVFFSPRGIISLRENFPTFVQNGTKIATFGESTAKEARDSGLRIDILAPTPEAPSMTMALDNFIKEDIKKNKNFE